jgi:hypothetical protein
MNYVIRTQLHWQLWLSHLNVLTEEVWEVFIGKSTVEKRKLVFKGRLLPLASFSLPWCQDQFDSGLTCAESVSSNLPGRWDCEVWERCVNNGTWILLKSEFLEVSGKGILDPKASHQKGKFWVNGSLMKEKTVRYGLQNPSSQITRMLSQWLGLIAITSLLWHCFALSTDLMLL